MTSVIIIKRKLNEILKKGKEGASITDTPTPIPAAGADAFYNYGSLPEKLWKKYIYASRFVNLVKAKTPKITLYDSKVCNIFYF